ncbi:MAG TPA: hydrolase 2, exosortase A system-associated [Steroidobacteraceae bacterium]|nr:hydrolase 2, exosortase A system-associated [Steroidobacteraceae bacterium]
MSGLVARFLGSPGNRIFVVSRRPAARASGTSVLLAPPFGEEMNKTRKMYSDVALALAERGIASVLPDLFGTGDSDGEFRDADWSRWIENLSTAVGWMADEGWPVRGVLGTRLGCSLAAEAVRASGLQLQASVFWQPVADGAKFLTQFLRLRVAASMMEQDNKETVGGLRQRMRGGEVLEVAGYDVSPLLAQQLEGVRLNDALGAGLGALHWMEVVRDAQAPLPADADRAVTQARNSGIELQVHVTAGEPFWTSTEIVRLPALTANTVNALSALA